MRMRRALPALLFLFVAFVASAHPHMWIDGVLDLTLDERGVSAVTVSWLFDEFNSADLIFTFDENLDGRLSRAEQAVVRERAFEHLISAGYFVVAFAGTDRLPVPEADSFSASIEDGQLRYEFSLPLRIRWDQMDNLVLALFDSSYYIDFLSEARSESYRHGRRALTMTPETLRLQSEGWGVIRVPALQVALR